MQTLADRLLNETGPARLRTTDHGAFAAWVKQGLSEGRKYLTFVEGEFQLSADEPDRNGSPVAVVESVKETGRLFRQLPMLARRSRGYLAEHRNNLHNATAVLLNADVETVEESLGVLSFDVLMAVAQAVNAGDAGRVKALLK